MHACCLISRVLVFASPWTGALQAPLSMGFSRQEYWGGLPPPSPGDLPHPGLEPASLVSPALAGRFFTSGTAWELSAGITYSNWETAASDKPMQDYGQSYNMKMRFAPWGKYLNISVTLVYIQFKEN